MSAKWVRAGLGALLLMAASCAGMEDTVRARAAHDFHCGESQLRILDQADTVFRIAGCGSEATFVCNDTRGLRTQCKRAEWEPQSARDRSQL